MRFRYGVLVLVAAAAVGGYLERDRLAPYLPEQLAALAAVPASPKADGAGDAKRDPQAAGKDGGTRKKGDAGRGERAVTVAAAQAGALPVLRSAVGTVVPLASTALSSLTTGTVAQILVKDGAEVRAGDLLVQLDDRTIKADIQRDTATLAKNQAALDQAQTTLKRVQALTNAGAQTQQQADDASSTARQAQAAIAVDQANLAADAVVLSQTQIRAPFDGRLGVVQPSLGAVVAPGAAIVTLTQMKPVYAEFSLPETDLDLVRTALSEKTLRVEIAPSLSDVHAPRLSGPMVFIDNAVDAASGTVKLRALVDNADGTLWPGQALGVTVHAGEKTNLAIVPTVAVQPQSDGSVAFVVGDDKTVKRRKVEVALIVGDTAGISKGLEPGETVVTEGQAGLVDGAHVAVVPAPGAGAGAGGKTHGEKTHGDTSQGDKVPGDKAPGDKAPGDKAPGDKAHGEMPPEGKPQAGAAPLAQAPSGSNAETATAAIPAAAVAPAAGTNP